MIALAARAAQFCADTLPVIELPRVASNFYCSTASGRVCVESMKKEEARRAVLSEYDRWAKKHPNDASMMGGFLFFQVRPSRFPCGWQQVANRSRLASRPVERLVR
jgi:hypothetical protein